MKTLMIAVVQLMLLSLNTAQAALYSQTLFSGSTAIPDGNPVGVTFAGNFTADPNVGDTVAGLTLHLNVSGGYNGDLYAYLVAPNGTSVTLLNRPGVTGGNPFGYAGSGLNVTLSDAGATSIQTTAETAGAVFTGTYQAAGTLANFNGSVADGTWTLFFADMSAGGGQASLTGWSLDITAVPEPVNVALGLFVGLLVVNKLIRHAGGLVNLRMPNAGVSGKDSRSAFWS